MSPHIRVLQNFAKQSDAQLAAFAGAIVQGMTGSTVFASPPVELKALQAAADDLVAAVAAQPHGGAAATAFKNNKRQELTALLRRMAHYVQDNSGGDTATVLNAGFTLTASSRAGSALEKPSILKIDFGNTTQLVLKVRPVVRAKCYEVRYAAAGNGGAVGPWQTGGSFTNSRSMIITGLTPGTSYAFQVRAFGSGGYTDWSDAVTHICV
jgi:hypothetical protein